MKESVGRLVLLLLYGLIYIKLFVDRLWLHVRRMLASSKESWSKIPAHVLIIAKDAHISPSLVKYLQSVVGVECVSVQGGSLASYNHQNYQPIKSDESSSFSVNLITEDGRVTMCRAIERLKREGRELSEEVITSAITTLPPIDLIVIFENELTVAGCCPWLIGFAEICHLPGMPVDKTSICMALDQYSRCQQRFGK